jgi:hypothetical protein
VRLQHGGGGYLTIVGTRPDVERGAELVLLYLSEIALFLMISNY